MRLVQLLLGAALLLSCAAPCFAEQASEQVSDQIPPEPELADDSDFHPEGPLSRANEPDNPPADDDSEQLPVDDDSEPLTQGSDAKTEASNSAEPSNQAEVQEEATGSSWLLMLVVAVLGAGAAWMFLGKKTERPTAVLITGPSNAGKTALFYTLKDGGLRIGTTVSVKENQGTFRLHKQDEEAEPVHLIDYPGEPQLGARLPDFFPITRKIIFMVDAMDKPSIEKYAAEAMYRLLTHPVIAEASPDILVVCNKCEHPLAAKCALLKKILEEELTKLITTSSVDISHDDSESDAVPLGQAGEKFEFDKHSPCDVRFLWASTSSGDGIDEVAQFCMAD